MRPSDPTRIALTWDPDDRRRRGRPKLTFKRMIFKERVAAGDWIEKKSWVGGDGAGHS